MIDRLIEIRKKLNITQAELARRVGVTRSAISRLESGDSSLTEQMIKSICREFNVDYMWFTTGHGEMFVDTDDYTAIIDTLLPDDNEVAKNVFKMFTRFSADDWKALSHMIDIYNDVSCNKKKPD